MSDADIICDLYNDIDVHFDIISDLQRQIKRHQMSIHKIRIQINKVTGSDVRPVFKEA